MSRSRLLLVRLVYDGVWIIICLVIALTCCTASGAWRLLGVDGCASAISSGVGRPIFAASDCPNDNRIVTVA